MLARGGAALSAVKPARRPGLRRACLLTRCVVESTADNAPQGVVDLGMVAIETSTGDVLYNQFRSAPCRRESSISQPAIL